MTTVIQNIYKIDENDNVRIWSMELDGANYRTVSGIQNGKLVESGWITAKGKNLGKKNETTPEKQAELTVERKYKEQLETGYYLTIEEARNNKGVVFEPMLAHKYTDLKKPLEFPVRSQPKLDGLRCYITKKGAYTRNHKEWVTIPHILKEVKPFFENYPNAILDGELYNHDLKSNFEKIVSLTRKTKPTEEDLQESAEIVEYHIFDVFDFDEPNKEFDQRMIQIFNLLNKAKQTNPNTKLRQVETVLVFGQETLDAEFAYYMENGYEGQMVRTNEPYEMKRSKTLLKRKEFEDAEFAIDHIESGQGNWDGYAKRVFIKIENGTIQKASIAGNFDYLKKVLQEADSFVNTDATVRFQGRTADGLLRFPVVKILWRDKRDV